MADDHAEALLQDGQTATRARSRRTETEQAQRRRRNNADIDTTALAVPEDIRKKLESEGLQGRWINDLGNRMYQKTKLDDWDPVEGIDPVPVGTDQRTGKPVMAHYCAKPKEFLEQDNAKRLETWNERERQSLAGRDPAAPIEGEYQPLGSQNSVRRTR
jgi:hypothetical protein